MPARRGLRAVFWSAADIGARQFLQFGIAIALARLLTPRDFGVVALMSLFLVVATVLSDGGFGVALIQRQEVTRTDESTVFWLNLAVGLTLSGLIAAMGPMIASFYDIPVLRPLAAVMGVSVALSSLGSIHETLLIKSLQFRRLLVASVASMILSGVVAILMAVNGFGVWSLAGQAVTFSIVNTGTLWLVHRWRPARTFSRASLRELFSFGGYMLASHLVDTTFTRAYTLFIGRIFGPVQVGYYNRADTSQQVPTNLVSSVISRVTLPLFSANASSPERLRRGTRLVVRSTMLVNVPMMLGIGALARPLVLVVFGQRWLPAVPLLQILVLGGVLWPIHVLNLNVLMAQGHSRLVWRLELVKKVLGLGLLALGATQGVVGVAWATVVFGAIAFGLNAHYTDRYLDYGARVQLADFLPVLAATAPPAFGSYVIASAWSIAPIVQLLVLGPLGIGVVLAILVVGRSSALQGLVTAFTDRGQVMEELS